jgi:hypothetical protein
MRVASLLIALAITTVAYAEEPQKPEARDHYKAGAAAFTNQDFIEASQEFSAAYEIEPMPELLWSWAQSERLAGNCLTATGLYRKYAREAQKPTQAKAANDMIAKCERDVPPLEPWYKNKLGGALTATGVVGVTVGVTFLALASSSHSAANQILADKGYLDDYEAKLDEVTLRRRIGGISLGVGIAALGAGATIYFLHDRNQRSLTAGTDGRVVFVGARF